MSLRPLLLFTLIVGLLYLLAACAVQDLNRGLQPRARKEYKQLTAEFAQAYPEIPQKQVAKSFKKLKYSESIYGPFTYYSDWANFLAFGDIKESLEVFPANPYAWSLLSDYLELERQPEAAIAACDKSLEAIEQFAERRHGDIDPRVAALRLTIHLDRAIYLNLVGRFAEAESDAARIVRDPTSELQKLGEAPLQVAATFVLATAQIGLNQLQDASQTLEEGEQRFVGSLSHSKLFDDDDYAQYFNSEKRHALFDYMRGEILLRQGKDAEAEAKLAASAQNDREFLAAQLSLATSLYAQKKYARAEKVLTTLTQESARSRLYTYYLAIFNLGNVYAVTMRPGRNGAIQKGCRGGKKARWEV